MVRSDWIRNIQLLHTCTDCARNQFIIGIYYISRSSLFSNYLRILNSKFIFVLLLILCSIGIIVNITKCKTIISGKGMQRGIIPALEVEGSVYWIS